MGVKQRESCVYARARVLGVCVLTAMRLLLVRAVLTVVITVTHPALRDTVARETLEPTGLTGVVTH